MKISNTHHKTRQGVVKRNPAKKVFKYKYPELKKYVEKLKANGFNVYYSHYSSLREEPISYVHFTKDGKIGYLQVEGWRGFSFTSVHKPNRETGTGYQIHTEIFKPTIDHAYDAFVKYPNWATSKEIESVIKYANFSEFKKRSSAKLIKL